MPNSQQLRERIHLRKSLPSPPTCRMLRQAAGVSLAGVAEVVGVTPSAVALWETGRRRPSGEHLSAYLEVLKIFRESAS